MFKYLRALMYLITGRFKAAANALNENPYVMEAVYDQAIEKKQARYQQTKTAVSRLIGILEKKRQELITATQEATRLEQVKGAAQVKAKLEADKLKAQGKSVDEIKASPDYIKYLGFFNDASNTLKEKNQRILDLEKDIAEHEKSSATYKAELQNMQRAFEKLKEEKSEAIADVQIAKEREEVNDLLAGITKDSGDADLASAREARRNAKARAAISSEIAGTDARAAEAELLEFAQNAAASSEFDALIGLDSEDKASEALDPAKLSE